MQRLNRLLPENDLRILSLAEIATIEAELLTFDIPRNVTIQAGNAQSVSMQLYRWLFRDQTKPTSGKQRYPRCHVRFDPWAQLADPKGDPNATDTYHFHRNSLYDGGIADAKFHQGCSSKLDGNFREAPWQVAFAGCGESQAGTGRNSAVLGRPLFDYHAGFEKVGDGLFQTTYAHLQL